MAKALTVLESDKSHVPADDAFTIPLDSDRPPAMIKVSVKATYAPYKKLYTPLRLSRQRRCWSSTFLLQNVANTR